MATEKETLIQVHLMGPNIHPDVSTLVKTTKLVSPMVPYVFNNMKCLHYSRNVANEITEHQPYTGIALTSDADLAVSIPSSCGSETE
jgi:hypothetical protein